MRSPAGNLTTPNLVAPGDLDRGQAVDDTHPTIAPVDLSPSQLYADTQPASAGGSLNGDHVTGEVHTPRVAGSGGNGQTSTGSQRRGADPSDVLLLILSDRLDDIEGLRKAAANQLSALTRSRDIPGGKGLSEYSRAAVESADWLAVLKQQEHKAVLALQRAMRVHPLGPWVKRTMGIGEKQGARLIAAIGDPAWNRAEGRLRRGPYELYAYCGYAPGQKRRKGVQSNWNAEAKSRAFLCAQSAQRQRCKACTRTGKETGDGWNPPPPDCSCSETHPLRVVYDRARLNWAEHDVSDGHKKQHALRLVAKAILKDLWREARAIRQADPTSTPPAPTAEEAS